VTERDREHGVRQAGQLVADQDRAERGHDRLLPGRGVLQHVLEQLGQVQDLHAVVPQDLREDVVLLLGPRGPGQAREEQLPGLARHTRFSSAPGRCTMTARSLPTSLSTPLNPGTVRPPGGSAFPVTAG
jgi:hypothetical protein